jgi:viroplasmin and RNaseH domain-containing protein
MKKYTHPKKNNSLVISKNGASNKIEIFSNNIFTNTSFDIRENIEILINTNEEEIKDINITTYINEYKYSNLLIWNRFN